MKIKRHQLDMAAKRLRAANLHCSRAATTLIKFGLTTSASQLNTIMMTMNEIADKAEGSVGNEPVQHVMAEIVGPLAEAADATDHQES